MKLKNKISNHAQQEILGFVLIVVIVMVIGLIFLSFSIGKGEVKKGGSTEISNLLEAAMSYTTDCSINEGYKELGDLIKSCYDNEKCYDKRESCEVVDKTLRKIITGSLVIGEDSVNKAYNLSVYYSEINSTIKDEKIKVVEGVFANCTSKTGASVSLVSNSLASGVINVEVEICKEG